MLRHRMVRCGWSSTEGGSWGWIQSKPTDFNPFSQTFSIFPSRVLEQIQNQELSLVDL